MKNHWQSVVLAISFGFAAQTLCAFLQSIYAAYDIYYPNSDAPLWLYILQTPIWALGRLLPGFIAGFFVKKYKWLVGGFIGAVAPITIDNILESYLHYPLPPSYSGWLFYNLVLSGFIFGSVAGMISNSFRQRP
jgi:hypothetical protein